MEPTQVPPVAASNWNITQQTVAGERQPAQVNASGRRYEWQQHELGLQKLLSYARGEGKALASYSKEVVSRLNQNCLSYQQFTYTATGVLMSIVQRIIPTGVLPHEVQQVVCGVDETDVFALSSAQSLHLGRKRDMSPVDYAVYISASRSLHSEATRLASLLESFSNDWGLHPIFLPESPDLTLYHIQNGIQRADLFIAVVDSFYGAPGSRTQTELRLANELATAKSKPWTAAIFFEHLLGEESHLFDQSPALFLYGKTPNESIERMASFSLSLLIRKRSREQGSHL